MSESDLYRPLKQFVATQGGARINLHKRLRDRIVEIAVEEWPTGCEDDRVEEVLRARVRRRVKDQYGSIIAAILISVLADLIVKAIVAWWKKRHSHRVLMEGWRAQSSPDLPPAGPAPEA